MNIIVTGAGRGIGYDTVKELAKNPDNQIIALSRNKANLIKLHKESSYGNIHTHTFDITDFTEEGFKSIIAPLGNIDILINNAGQLINKQFEDLTKEDWQTMFEVNLFGVVAIIQAALPYLRNSNAPHIVNIGSMGGVQGTSKFPGLAPYSASKAALANLTECLAEELKEENIKVNCLALGSVNTEMLQNAFPEFNAPVNSDDMAQFISWFSQNGQRFMNGKIIPASIGTP